MVACLQIWIGIQGNMDRISYKREYIIFSLFDNDINVRLADKCEGKCIKIEKWNTEWK